MSGQLLRFELMTNDAALRSQLAHAMDKSFSAHRWWSEGPNVKDDASGDLVVTMRGDGSVDPLDDAFMAFNDIETLVSTLESLGAHDWTLELEGSPKVRIVQGARDQELATQIAMGTAATFVTPESPEERIERVWAEDE